MKKRVLSLLLAAMMLLSLLTGCATTGGGGTSGGGTTHENSKEGYGSITIAYTEPNTLNLLTSQSNMDMDVFYLTSVMLYRPYGDTVEPEMVTDLTVSDDNLTYTYTLREAYYTDGSQVTAQDFVYYILNAIMAQEEILNYLHNGRAYIAGECEGSEVGCYAADDLTLVVKLDENAAGFDPEMQIYPLQQSYAEQKGDALGGTAADFLCSGPYILTDWTYGASLSFEKNQSYWNAENSFQIAKVKIIHGTDANAQYNMFTTGEADILQSTSEEIVGQLPADQIRHYMVGALQGIQFNTTGFYYDGTTFAQRDPEVTALLANRNFRMALCYALDRETIVSTVDTQSVGTNRYFDVCQGATEGKSFVEEYPIDVAPVNGDEELARQYLAAALEELNYSDVSQLPTVKYLTFENANFRLIAETIQSEWKRVLGLENIEIELKPIQDAIMSMVYMNYDIYYQATAVKATNMLSCMNWWTTGGSMSDVMQAGAPFSSIYSNADFDALVAQANSEFDQNKRYELIAQAEEVFLNDYILIPVLAQGGDTAIGDRVSGYVVADLVPGLMLNNATVND